MDVPNSSPEAAEAAETSHGPVSDSPAATSPSSAIESIPRSPAMQHPPRPRQMRSGAIAAACAIVVVIGVTALPAGTGSNSGPAAGFTPVATLALENLPLEGGLPAFDLGTELGTFTIPGSPSWKEYANGSATISVWFRSETIADAVFAGEIRLTRPVDGDDATGDAVVLVDPTLGGQTVGTAFDDGSGYAELEGELFGRGALDGVMLRIEGASASTIRRGTWRSVDGENVQDAVFARFTWTSEGEPARDVDVPARGNGTLACKLRPTGRN